MKLSIFGDLNKYYLQTLCMLFVPGAKFATDEEDTSDTSAVFERADIAKEDGEYVTVTCTFSRGDKTSSATQSELVGGRSKWLGGENILSEQKAKASKLAAGKAALKAGSQLFGTVPSWGVLTGIRPAKMASALLTAHGEDGTKLHTPSNVRAMLTGDFALQPRKAALAVDIAKNEQKIVRLTKSGKSPTCSIYISIPFCPSRCAYCSFVSYTSQKLLSLIPAYLEQLMIDIKKTVAYIKSHGFRITTVYIGGGTPTTLDERQLEMLLSTVANALDTSRLYEFTLEAGRPDTINSKKLEIARTYGVSRMSINPQTMNDEILRGIGRKHTVADFYRAYTIAKNSGIKIINTDLIAGLPGDYFENFAQTVDKMIALDPENITVHTFCVKKSAEILRADTEIYNRSAVETVKGVDYSQIRLKNAGYNPYYIYRQKNTVGNLENVGFAKRGTEGLYNVLMMEELHTIFAVGAGAVTKLVRTDDSGKKQIKRIFEPKYPYEYLATERDSATANKFIEADRFFGFFESGEE